MPRNSAVERQKPDRIEIGQIYPEVADARQIPLHADRLDFRRFLVGSAALSWLPLSRLLLGWLLLGWLSANLCSHPLRADDASELAVAISRVKSDLTYLASDELAGRGVGTQGIEQAGEFIANRFKELGLEVDAFDGTPFQNFGIPGPIGLGPEAENGLSFTLKGQAQRELKLSVDFTPLALGLSGQFSGQVVFAGYGISAPELGYDDYAGWDPVGKVVIVIRKEPQQNDPNSVFDGQQNSNYAFFTSKQVTAAQKKVAAMIIINDAITVNKELAKVEDELKQAEETLTRIRSETAPSEPTLRQQFETRLRIAGQSVEALRAKKSNQAGDPVMTPDAAGRPMGRQSVPTLYCTRATIDELLMSAGVPALSELEQAIDRDGKPQSRLLEGVEAVGQTKLQSTQTPVRNVIAVHPGAGELANQFVVVGAHYDHVGMGGMGSLAPGTIAVHNGADDNGSGTVTMLEVARQLSTNNSPNRRTILFMAFTAEESGLLGSVHYVRNPRWPLDKTVAMINLDMVGRLLNDELTVYGTGTAVEFNAQIDRLNQSHRFRLVKVPQGRGASDHQSFYDVGIPVYHFFTGLHNEYHRPSDDVDLINMLGIARISRMVSELTQEIAESPARPQYLQIRGSAAPRSQVATGRAVIGVRLDRGLDVPVKLVDVNEGGPAATAGLQAGDTITKINDISTPTIADFREAMSKLKAGQTVLLEYAREGISMTVEVKLGE